MPAALERLIYQSTATGSTGSLLNLATILAESQRNNDRAGLTGVLAAHGERFIQAVEGPSDALDLLLARLAHDPRHRDIQMIDRFPVTARAFTGWTLASPRFSPAMTASLDALMQEPAPSGERVVALLRQALATHLSQAA